MAPISTIDNLCNPLAKPQQIVDLRDSDAVKQPGNGDSVRFAQAQLTQAAGVLLRLPQEVIAQAIVLTTRFSLNGGWSENVSTKDASAAAIFLGAKVSPTPRSVRSVVNVYAFLSSPASTLHFMNPEGAHSKDPNQYFVSEGSYEKERLKLAQYESIILKTIGFDLHVALPYKLAFTYLQVLGAPSPELSTRIVEHLNGALLSPQFLYVTHQPKDLAVAAIYLAAREIGVKLVDGNWWEVFDIDREDLGFLVVAFGSIEGFAKSEKEKWKGGAIALD
ncbi:MAG: hypothetical protein Q9160_008366 [Pyrenula sp. 1 TL-2023]